MDGIYSSIVMELTSSIDKKAQSPLHAQHISEQPKTDIDTELIQWIKRNKATTSLDPRHKDHTFIDESGIRRYEDNWLPACTSAEYNRIHKTGCVEKSIGFLYESSDQSNADNEIRFLVDWKLLWVHLEADNVDEIAKQLPLFKLFIDFYFHQRTSQCVLFLAVYLTVSQSIIFAVFPIVPKNIIAVSAVYCWCETFVYLAFRYMFKGSLFGDNSQIDAAEAMRREAEEFNGKDEESSKSKEFKHSAHWTSSLRRMIRLSFNEVQNLILQAFHLHRQPNRKSATFYELMNMSLKFLVRLNGANLKRINFDRPTYRLLLLLILFIFPFYAYFSTFFPSVDYNVVCPGPKKFYDSGATLECQYYTWYLITTGYATIPCVLNILFGSGVLIGLVSLAYGCEIAYQLTHAWIHRFKGLHRVEAPGEDEADGDCESTSDDHGALVHEKSRRHLSEIIKLSNDYESMESSKQVYFKQRGKGAMAVVPSLQLQQQHSASAGSVLSREEQLLDMVPLIGIDAREHYLFMREYLSQAGKVWSANLVGLVAIFILVTVVSIYFRVNFQLSSVARVVVGVVLKFLILIVYPVVSIAYANSFVYELKELFTIAAEEEYSIIGGKAKWMSLLEAAPVVWTVFGFWITYDKLFAMLWALLSAAAAIGITLVTAKL